MKEMVRFSESPVRKSHLKMEFALPSVPLSVVFLLGTVFAH
jgi:hypothetical protein